MGRAAEENDTYPMLASVMKSLTKCGCSLKCVKMKDLFLLVNIRCLEREGSATHCQVICSQIGMTDNLQNQMCENEGF